MDNKEYQKQWIEIGKKRGLDIDEYVYDKYNDELQNVYGGRRPQNRFK